MAGFLLNLFLPDLGSLLIKFADKRTLGERDLLFCLREAVLKILSPKDWNKLTRRNE